MKSEVDACGTCLRRAWAVGDLSARIERALEGAPGGRVAELLALEEGELRRALPGGEADPGAAPGERAMRAALERADVWACCLHDQAYPKQLRDLRLQAPACLFGRGDRTHLALLQPRDCITVVGSRRPSAYGREMALRLGRELGGAGLVVVSGMALGIDSCAHQGALANDGLTVAVLGSGADVASPARMRRLYGEIVASGLVLSELPPGLQPRRWSFPARNRIMAALGAISVVVEARSRSGSLITAEMAQDLGRDVGAVPGRVGAASAAGANQLLREGAQVVRFGQDVLDSLLGPGVRSAHPGWVGPELDPELSEVLELVEGGAGNLDEIAAEGGLGVATAAAALTRLELLGYLRCDSAGRYESSRAE